VDTLNAVNTPGVGAHLRLDRAYLEKQIPISAVEHLWNCSNGARTFRIQKQTLPSPRGF